MLLRGIAQDHPFVDGNKRTAYEVADTFLDRNGLSFAVDEDAVVDLVVAVARGHLSLKEISSWLRGRTQNG